MPAAEGDLINQLREKFSISLLDAALLVEHLGFSSQAKNQPDIGIEREVVVNGLPGVQFAVRNWEGETFIRTSIAWRGESELIDITGFPQSLDESDQSMRTYNQLLSSFQYTGD